jgi:hypothetical protein
MTQSTLAGEGVKKVPGTGHALSVYTSTFYLRGARPFQPYRESVFAWYPGLVT